MGPRYLPVMTTADEERLTEALLSSMGVILLHGPSSHLHFHE